LVRSIHYIECDGPVIGIDNHFHRIANVVDVAVGLRLGVGEPPACGVGVLYPIEPPVADHHIGVVIKLQERRDRLHTILNVAMEHDPAVVDDVAAEQDVDVVQIPGEQRSPNSPVDIDAVHTVIICVDVVLSRGIIEFRRAALNDHVPPAPWPK
jgi:hypothetical protein